jgi:hypothetical protein
MKPVLALEETGVKINQLPVDTVTNESDVKASKASGIGEGGVSAQTTKPTKTIRAVNRIPITALLLRRTHFHQSSCYLALNLPVTFLGHSLFSK